MHGRQSILFGQAGFIILRRGKPNDAKSESDGPDGRDLASLPLCRAASPAGRLPVATAG